MITIRIHEQAGCIILTESGELATPQNIACFHRN